jgi:hypothetical protein
VTGELSGAGMSPHQIYEYLTHGPGSGTLDEAQAATRAEWTREEARALLIRRQGELIQSGWQGAASDAALGAALPLAESALRGADQLSRAEDLLDRQSGSFNRAANSVRPVPPEPPKMDILDAMAPFADYEKQVRAYQADAQHNIEVFRGYDSASEYNETNLPSQYRTISHSGGDIGVTGLDPRRDDIGLPVGGGDHEPPKRGTESGPPPAGSDSHRGTPAGGSPVSTGDPVRDSRQPQVTRPSDVTPSSTDSMPGLVTSAGPEPGGAIGGPPGGGLTTGGPGPRGGGPGSGGPAPRGGGPAPRGGDPGSGGRGPGVRGGALGAGPGALAAEEVAVRRAAAAAGARGSGASMMGGAPVGTGRGKGDDDEEHQRKVLIETDAEGTFGSDLLTAPPVIGDDEYEDD